MMLISSGFPSNIHNFKYVFQNHTLRRYISCNKHLLKIKSSHGSVKLQKNNWNKAQMVRSNPYVVLKNDLVKPQIYDYFLIMDFEATCDKNKGNYDTQEIIEFPVLKFNPKSLRVESQFHAYVRPRLHPTLSPFCISLTGIIQDMVDNSQYFPEVYSNYLQWHEQNIGSSSFLPVTCGDHDLLNILPRQCKHDGIEPPEHFTEWHNVKLSYCSVTNRYSKSMSGIIKGLGVERVGKAHSGLDDCHTLAKCVAEILRKGFVFGPTNESIPLR